LRAKTDNAMHDKWGATNDGEQGELYRKKREEKEVVE
jgi:hypothetical protein